MYFKKCFVTDHTTATIHAVLYFFIIIFVSDRFLVDATKVVENQITIEGIFRKAGSIARQKELKVILCIRIIIAQQCAFL